MKSTFLRAGTRFSKLVFSVLLTLEGFFCLRILARDIITPYELIEQDQPTFISNINIYLDLSWSIMMAFDFIDFGFGIVILLLFQQSIASIRHHS
jgi:hypothetical protein